MTIQMTLLLTTLCETIAIIIMGTIGLKAFNKVIDLEIKFSILMEYIKTLDNKVEIMKELWDAEKESTKKPSL